MQNSKTGLSTAEAKQKLLQFGPNQLYKPSKISFFSIAKHEIVEPMIILLFVVGFFYSLWGKLEDALTIFVVIILLVLAEVYNEFRAKKAIAALEKIAAPKTKVVRDNQIAEINSADIVPEDLLVLTAGTKIAADATVKNAIGLEVDESALTGEAFPQAKNAGTTIYAGTIIVAGEGTAAVITTGSNTKFGKIAAQTETVRPPRTKLQLAMRSLAGKLVYVAVFFAVIIPVIGILRGQDFKTMVLTGLALAFATIPEELPIVITMVLGLGSYVLSKSNFWIKRIKATETLGNATVIVTDKTGTITTGKMSIANIFPNNEKEVVAKAINTLSLLAISPLDQKIKQKSEELKLSIPTSTIVRERTMGNGKKTKAILRSNNNTYELFVSGAPEEIFAICNNDIEPAKNNLISETNKGRRVIGIASKLLNPGEEKLEFNKLENNLNFIGLISFEDQPRPGVAETIELAKRAGIRTIMITGDHPQTAKYIAQQVGIAQDASDVYTGDELDKTNDALLQIVVKKVSVYARTTPEHKYRVVKALQNNGEVVAVTGDGINDAIALKGADIGIAMGLRGTDVAKEAAEVVLADDNYITITKGIFEGRKFFDNLKKGIKYYLAVKLALILLFLVPVLLNIPLPLTPIQIIILELFMDLAASAGFVAEPAEKNIYSRPARSLNEQILNTSAIIDIFIKGFLLFIGVIAVYFYGLHLNHNIAAARTCAFAAWMLGHVFLAYSSRSDIESIFSRSIFANKIINLWAIAAIGLLILGIYWPFLSSNLNLQVVSPIILLLIALVMIGFIDLLELKKLFQK